MPAFGCNILIYIFFLYRIKVLILNTNFLSCKYLLNDVFLANNGKIYQDFYKNCILSKIAGFYEVAFYKIAKLC